MKLPDALLEVLKHDGVVAIGTTGPEGQHMVNTWNGYVQVTEDGRLLVPAGYMHRTEANLAADDRVLVTLGSSKVRGKNAMGTGFLLRGTAAFLSQGAEFDRVKGRFSWARAALVITPSSAEQTL
jgi:hypothetical protein